MKAKWPLIIGGGGLLAYAATRTYSAIAPSTPPSPQQLRDEENQRRALAATIAGSGLIIAGLITK